MFNANVKDYKRKKYSHQSIFKTDGKIYLTSYTLQGRLRLMERYILLYV